MQLSALPLAVSGVQPGKLLDQHAHRPAIGDDVMQGQHQHVVINVQLQQADAQQRAVLQVERPGNLRFDFFHRRFKAQRLGFGAQIVLFDGQRGEARQGLYHLAVVLDKTAAQALMPLQQHVETLL